MAKVTPTNLVSLIHGKLSKQSNGYFYATAVGKQKYRVREENYQQVRSPKQLWHTDSFRWAQQQLLPLLQDPQTMKQIESEWKAAKHRTASGREYATARDWKFASLQLQWKEENPFETWYTDYLQHISEAAEQKTASENTSNYMLQQQISLLQAQIDELKARLGTQS